MTAYNVFAYCANNPIVFYDPTGGFILTAIIVGVVAGAVIGGAVGGTAAYNSAKSSGAEGSELFWATASGIGKGAAIGGVAGGLIGATGGVGITYGFGSVASTAMTTCTLNVAAKATEVTVLQTKKSKRDGDNNWQVIDDCINSVFYNAGAELSPLPVKASTTFAGYLKTGLFDAPNPAAPLGLFDYLTSKPEKFLRGKLLPYMFVGYNWSKTVVSIYCYDPEKMAAERGYYLL